MAAPEKAAETKAAAALLQIGDLVSLRELLLDCLNDWAVGFILYFSLTADSVIDFDSVTTPCIYII